MNLENIFPKDSQFTIISGAGISMEKPSELPSSNQIKAKLISIILSEKFSELTETFSKKLRFEQIVEIYQKHFDPQLSFLKSFDDPNIEPNKIHDFLAHMALLNHNIVTFNFDCLIEKSIHRIDKEASNVRAIITDEQYESFIDMNNDGLKENTLIFKLHGSFIDYHQRKSTHESIVVTTNNLCRDSSLETFSLPQHKIIALKKLISNRKTIFIGYSGSDDFDINPTLKNINFDDDIIWIHHSNNDIQNVEIFEIENTPEDIKKENFYRTLINIKNKAKLLNNDININIIKISTTKLIDFLFKRYITRPISNPQNITKEKIPLNFIKTPIDRLDHLDIICQYLFELGEMEYLNKYSKIGLNHSQSNMERSSTFNRYRGLYYRHTNEKDNSIKILKSAIKYNSRNNKHSYALLLNELGRTYEHFNMFNKAKKYYKKAFKVNTEEYAYLNNLANIYSIKKRFLKAKNKYEHIIKNNSENKVALTFAHINLANLHFSRRLFDKGIEYIEKAINLAGQTGDYLLKSQALLKSAEFHDYLKSFDKSKILLDDVYRISCLLQDIDGIAKSSYYLGANHFSKSDYTSAIEKYIQAEKQFEYLGNYRLQAEVNHRIAGTHARLCNMEKAFQHEQKAVSIAKDNDLNEVHTYLKYLNMLNRSNN